MDKFCLVAIMLFAIQRDMIDYPITDVINAIDRERGTMSRINFLKVVFKMLFMSIMYMTYHSVNIINICIFNKHWHLERQIKTHLGSVYNKIITDET